MPRGRYPTEYFHTPSIDKPIEAIYADLDDYTGEFFQDEPQFSKWYDMYVALPPLLYEGRFVKGAFFTQGTDYLAERFPQLSGIFFNIAYSMWGSYPWSLHADGYFSLYRNTHREAWFKQTHPHRAQKYLIPLQDSDFTHEYVMAPVPVAQKDIDLICVSRLSALKNIPMIGRALKVYRQKYPANPIRMTLVTGKDFNMNRTELTESEKEELRQLETILEHPHDYIDFVGFVDYNKQLPQYYSRSRASVLGSLLEGKNRFISESMACNTPVVCFKQFNQYIRGEDEAILPKAGLYAPYYEPESLADTIYTVLQNPHEFTPRQSYLRRYGRKNFFNTLIDSIPYYANAIPGYQRGRHYDNLWLDLALQHNYQVSLHDFLYDYGKVGELSSSQGIHNIEKVLHRYTQRFAP